MSKIFPKHILMLYRSKNESNAVSSCFVNHYNRTKAYQFQLETFNLDKRNIEKFLETQEALPERIYIYEKDGLIAETLKAKFPSVEICTYYSKRINGNKKMPYEAVRDILSAYMASTGTIDLYQVINEKLHKITLTRFEYEKLKETGRCYNYYEDENEAKEVWIQAIQAEKERCENMICYYQNKKEELTKILSENDF